MDTDPGFVHRGGGDFERSERRAKRETSEARDERSERRAKRETSEARDERSERRAKRVKNSWGSGGRCKPPAKF